MSQPFKVHELLSIGQLAELEQFAREPGRTINECREWLGQHGFELSQTAVWNWLRAFKEQLLAERFRRSSDLAMAMKGAVTSGNFGDVADAAVMQLTQVIFEQAVRLDEEGSVESRDLVNMATALRQAVGSKQQILKLAAEKFEREAARLVESRRQITADDIAQVRKAVFG
jgi:hypothetical protein